MVFVTILPLKTYPQKKRVTSVQFHRNGKIIINFKALPGQVGTKSFFQASLVWQSFFSRKNTNSFIKNIPLEKRNALHGFYSIIFYANQGKYTSLGKYDFPLF